MGKSKDVTPLRTDKSGSSKENIKIKKCEIENFKEVTPYRLINQINQTSLTTIHFLQQVYLTARDTTKSK